MEYGSIGILNRVKSQLACFVLYLSHVENSEIPGDMR